MKNVSLTPRNSAVTLQSAVGITVPCDYEAGHHTQVLKHTGDIMPTSHEAKEHFDSKSYGRMIRAQQRAEKLEKRMQQRLNHSRKVLAGSENCERVGNSPAFTRITKYQPEYKCTNTVNEERAVKAREREAQSRANALAREQAGKKLRCRSKNVVIVG